jgi:hypothetical protein
MAFGRVYGGESFKLFYFVFPFFLFFLLPSLLLFPLFLRLIIFVAIPSLFLRGNKNILNPKKRGSKEDVIMADNVENNVENMENSDEYVLATKGIEAIKPRLPGAKTAEIAEQESLFNKTDRCFFVPPV